MQTIILEENNPDIIKQKLQLELRDYNHPFLGDYQRKNFALSIEDIQKNVIAGIYGFIITPHAVMRVEFAWVHEQHRRQGVGSDLFRYLEGYAYSKQCKKIQVSTGNWQGKTFYQKLGYKIMGVIPQWFCNQDEIFFCKELS
jgi:ribosomal protein S18 acetylase RimI-like enzyme